MYSHNLFIVSLLAASAAAVPAKRADKGVDSSQNVPITDSEWANLKSMGSKRSLEARGMSTMNCGHKVSGKGGSNGNGVWVPVGEFQTQARNFCDAYIGTDVAPGHETSDTYPTSLTNQKDDTQKGPDGFIVFAVYNTSPDRLWTMDSDTCYTAMIFPLGKNLSKRNVDGVEYVDISRRDNCYGAKHHDYEGGYTKVDDVLAIGSEVYVKVSD